MGIAVRTTLRASAAVFPTRPAWFAFSANAIALAVALTMLFTLHVSTHTVHLGQVAGDTIVAQRTVTYVDRVTTDARRTQARARVGIQYTVDSAGAWQAVKMARTFFDRAIPVIAGHGALLHRMSALRGLLPPGATVGPLQTLASLHPDGLASVSAQTIALLQQAARTQFDQNQINSTELALLGTLPSTMPVRQRTSVGQLLALYITPTQIPDFARTNEKRNAVARSIPPITNTLYQGQAIIRRGDLVTPAIMEQLTALGLQSKRTGWQDVLGSFLFAAVIVVMLFWYLLAFHDSVVANPRILLLVDASVVVSVVAIRLVGSGHIVVPYMLPMAAASTFAAALIAPEACIAIALAMALLSGWVVDSSFELTLYYFLTGAAGVLAIRHVRQLKQFVVAGAYITAFGLSTLVAFGMMNRAYDLGALQDYVFAAGFNGFVSSALALGAFAVLSSLFGITTSLHLLELGQPSQSLMRRLMVKAPGTYNHSLIVASMVERAAEEIGANSLAAKVGALYHDVGKTTNPHCFVENQLGMGNIHDELTPIESARLIRGHVQQGLRMARQNRLPRLVLDAIAEHHGTMTIAYFLQKARQESGDTPVDLTLYTYPGPRPQSKETALIMLADGSEAAVRSANDHSPTRISEIIHRIFQDRINSGQLDECPLTLKDLDRIQETFSSVLNSLYHPRIDYPEPVDVSVHAPIGSLIQ